MSAVAYGPRSEEALDALLGQLAGGSLVLTDGQGAVSKWSEEADLLFGRSGPDVLGRAFFDTLIAAPLAPSGEGWRRFLQSGVAPGARAKVELHAQHAGGHAFVIELVMIPVKLDEGFDFSLFLEDLAFELEPAQMLMRLRGQHPVVVRALRTALAEEPMAWEPGWRTAGTLIAFRPLCETPWVDAERENRARAAAESEAAMALPDPVAEVDPTEAIAGFADAGQIIERLLGAVHKLDALEATAAALPAAVEAVRLRAEDAEREARAARAELDRRSHPAVDPGLERRLALLEGTDPAALVRERLAAHEAAAEALEVRTREAERLAREALERPVAEPLDGLAEEVAGLHERTEAAARLAREALERPVAEPAGELRDRLADLEAAQARLAGLEEEARTRAQEAERLAREALGRPVAEPIDGVLAELGALRERAQAAEALAREALARPVAEPVEDLRERLAGLESSQSRLADLERAHAAVEERAETAARLAREALDRPAVAEGAQVTEALEAELRQRLAALEEAQGRVGELERGHAELRRSAQEAAGLAREALGRPVAQPVDELWQRVSALESTGGRIEGLEQDQAALRARADEAAGLLREALDRPVAEPLGELWGRLTALEAAHDEVGRTAREALDRPVAEPVGDLRAEVAELRELLDAMRAEAAEAARGQRATDGIADDVAALGAGVEALRAEAAGLRDMVADMQVALESLESPKAREEREAAVRAELDALVGQVQGFAIGFDEARQAAVSARREAEQARAAAASAGEDSERSVQKLSSAWMELLSPGRTGSEAGARRLPARRLPEPVDVVRREPRAGFDDVAAPMAVLALDGHFRELNPAFGTLVGYGEHEFTKAVWPSAHDRGDYREQQEQLRRMATGDLESVQIRSTYMHQQGLMVPVAGELRVVRDSAGRPEHLLLRAEDRTAH